MCKLSCKFTPAQLNNVEAPLTIDNSRPLYRYENNAGGHYQKQWKRRGFNVRIGPCMTGACIREGQRQLRLDAVVRGMVICLW
eukprot:scaffold100899_cov52-Attheya_sp.AAC.1